MRETEERCTVEGAVEFLGDFLAEEAIRTMALRRIKLKLVDDLILRRIKLKLVDDLIDAKVERFSVENLRGVRVVIAGESSHRYAQEIRNVAQGNFDIIEVHHIFLGLTGPNPVALYTSHPHGLKYNPPKIQIDDYFPGFGATCPVELSVPSD